MLTKKDIQKLEQHFLKIFATKDELQAVRTELKNDILNFKDAILWEIKGLREEMAVMTGWREMIARHDERLEQDREWQRQHEKFFLDQQKRLDAHDNRIESQHDIIAIHEEYLTLLRSKGFN